MRNYTVAARRSRSRLTRLRPGKLFNLSPGVRLGSIPTTYIYARHVRFIVVIKKWKKKIITGNNNNYPLPSERIYKYGRFTL